MSELGSQTSTVVYPLLTLALDRISRQGRDRRPGVVAAGALFASPAGALADRVDRKRLMIAGDAIRMLRAASIVAALWLGTPRSARP